MTAFVRAHARFFIAAALCLVFQAIDTAGYHGGFAVVVISAALAAAIAAASYRTLRRVTTPAEEGVLAAV